MKRQQETKYAQHYDEFQTMVSSGMSRGQAARNIVSKYRIDSNPESVRKEFNKRSKRMGSTIDNTGLGTVNITAPNVAPRADSFGGSSYQWNEANHAADLSFRTTRVIKSLDDALEEANVDLSVWEVANWRFNVWEGPTSSDAGQDVVKYYQVKISFKKKDVDKLDYVQMSETLLPMLSKAAPAYKAVKYETNELKRGVMVEFCAYDLHYGKLCWAPESGENFDSTIARERLGAAVSSSFNAVSPYNIDKILFVVGNDYFNSDNANQTTHAGTPQTDDHRWQKVFAGGVALLVETIDYMAQFAPVEVMVIQGNHDWERIFYAGTVLEARYANCEYVNVNNIPTPRKYYKYGKNLLGFTHGNNEKVNDLPMIMAQEASADWAATRYREFHLGHLHHNETKTWISDKDYIGVKVRRMRSLTSNDAWHNMKGYVGQTQSAETYVWDKEYGLVSVHYHNI